MIKKIAIPIALCLISQPAWSLTMDQCDNLQSMITSVMEVRQSGIPAQRLMHAFRDRAEPTDVQLQFWGSIVHAVYQLPRSNLTGPERADFLTQWYRQCLEMEFPKGE